MRRKIQRFPRLDESLSKEALLRIRVELGFIPKKWRRLTRIQRKVARRYARGDSVRDISDKLNVDKAAIYRWINLHPKFRRYLYACAEAEIKNTPERLLGRLPRAVKIIEDGMESEDPYFAYGVAKDYLRGMGTYKTNVATKQEVSGNVKIDQRVEYDILPPALQKQFVEMLLTVASGPPALQPKVIDISPGAIKELPPAPGIEENAPKEIQESGSGEAGGRTEQSSKKRKRRPAAN